ncbi:hypothetical protein ABFW11_25415, partial [Mycolicibacterium porcinum]|uniref:hypothetical protein n=1 Tax=Mycolicibacterium porcinum TaxID=39693 RepID=UPI0034CE9A82
MRRSEQRFKRLIYHAIDLGGRAHNLMNIATYRPADNMARAVHVNHHRSGERELVSGHSEQQVVHRRTTMNVLTPARACCDKCRRVAQGSRNTEAVPQEVEALDPRGICELLHASIVPQAGRLGEPTSSNG